MSFDRLTVFTKENLDGFLKELGKEFRKLNGTEVPAEIILIGGASVLANYGFRDITTVLLATLQVAMYIGKSTLTALVLTLLGFSSKVPLSLPIAKARGFTALFDKLK